MPHSEIDVLACEVHVMQCCGYAQIKARMSLGKAAKPVDQPLGGKIRRGAHGNDAGALTLDQTLRADGDAIKGISQNDEVFPSRFCDDQSLAFAIEQLDTEVRLQGFYLMAHSALRDA